MPGDLSLLQLSAAIIAAVFLLDRIERLFTRRKGLGTLSIQTVEQCQVSMRLYLDAKFEGINQRLDSIEKKQ